MLLSVLVALTAIMVTTRAMGALAQRFNQPAVIGEVIGGIMLGPSLLGWLAPQMQHALLPGEAIPVLGMMAQIGVLLYMFLVGLELDIDSLRGRAGKTMAISATGIVVPFALGAVLALQIFEDHAPQGVSLLSFLLFIGVSMAITAFPVLARILGDRRLQRTPIGILALTCAAIDDVSAWCLLAFVVSVSQNTPADAIKTTVLTAAYIGLMLTVGRMVMTKIVARLDETKHIGENALTLLLLAVLASAIATEYIGVHAIFGAFLLGAIIPHDSAVSEHARIRIEDLVKVSLLPAFFAMTGLRTQVGLLTGAAEWALCGVIILIAVAGKFGGVTVAARLTGSNWRDSATLGALMNTRGLVELIVLNLGLDLGVLTPRLFTMLVIMALVTTMMTSPVLTSLQRRTLAAAA
ncbi:MAG TPA: cation:proton antiporter [Vicinamibacterales bacterium]